MPTVTVIERERRDLLGEGPVWSAREGRLYWVDILDPHLNRLDLESGEVGAVPLPEPTGWIIERESGGFVAGCKSGVHALWEEPPRLERLIALEPDRPGNRMNDAKADRAGRLWAGTMGDGRSASGALYRILPDLTAACVDSPYVVANGPAIGDDGRTFLHTDSAAGKIWKFDLSPDGDLSNKRLFLEFPHAWGSPDGMTFDAEGALWVAHWGGACISRFSPEGERLAVVDLPTPQITSIAFAGEDLGRVFVTSSALDRPNDPLAGCLFEITGLGARGLAPCRFGG